MTDRADRIAWMRISSCYLPLANPISDAKVLTGRQMPMTAIATRKPWSDSRVLAWPNCPAYA